MTETDPANPGPAPASTEHLVREWLEGQNVEPSASFRRRGRSVVRAALDDALLRRRAGVLLLTGWLGLALAVTLLIMES